MEKKKKKELAICITAVQMLHEGDLKKGWEIGLWASSFPSSFSISLEPLNNFK